MTARLYADKIQSILNTPVVVENKPGAFEQLAAQTALSSPPDGHTLWLGTAGALTMGPGVRTGIPFDVVKDFSHIAKIGEVNAVLMVKNGLPVNSLGELLTYAKANPNKLFYASGGLGSGGHLLMEYVLSVTGTKITHVPFKSDVETAREVVAGTVDMGLAVSSQASPFVTTKKAKAVAATGSLRIKALPETPTFGEAGIDALKTAGVYSIYGLLGPAGMPPATVQALNDAFAKAARMPDLQQRLEEIHVKATTSTPTELRDFIRAENKKWGDLFKSLNITITQ